MECEPRSAGVDTFAVGHTLVPFGPYQRATTASMSAASLQSRRTALEEGSSAVSSCSDALAVPVSTSGAIQLRSSRSGQVCCTPRLACGDIGRKQRPLLPSCGCRWHSRTPRMRKRPRRSASAAPRPSRTVFPVHNSGTFQPCPPPGVFDPMAWSSFAWSPAVRRCGARLLPPPLSLVYARASDRIPGELPA